MHRALFSAWHCWARACTSLFHISCQISFQKDLTACSFVHAPWFLHVPSALGARSLSTLSLWEGRVAASLPDVCMNPGEFRIFARRSLSVCILPYVTCIFVLFAHVSLMLSLLLSSIYLLQILMVLFCLENVYSQFFYLLITFINVSFAIFMTSGYLCLSRRWHSCLWISYQAFYCFVYLNWALEHV